MLSIDEYLNEIDFPVTVCDTEGIILAMNQRAIAEFESDGGSALIGTSLLNCHPEPSRSKLVHMLQNQVPHTYISSANGRKQFVHETPWYRNGEYCGFIEILIDITDVEIQR